MKALTYASAINISPSMSLLCYCGCRHVVGPPHVWTLLDGEMVVDTIPGAKAGGRPAQQRRFLIYDVMYVNGHNVMGASYQDRWYLIDKHIIEPRTIEKKAIEVRHRDCNY